MRRIIGGHPLGIWVALSSMLFCLVLAGAGQAISLINWDLAVKLRLQENDPNSQDTVQRVLAQTEWGVCLADVFLVLPLFAVGFVGVLIRRNWGMITGMMASGCWVYMFVVYAAQRYAVVFRGGMGHWSDYSWIIMAFALLCLCPCFLTIWGLSANADRFSASYTHSHMLRRNEDRLEPYLMEDFVICTGQVLCAVPQVLIGKRLSWNTQHHELVLAMAGDEFIKDAVAAHRAITIARPSQEVWPWIAQFGRGAGYYSWDFLDNRGHRHADYLLDVPEPRVGDRQQDLGRICYVETGKELVWYDEPDFLGMKPKVAITFRLDPAHDNATRLHFRLSIGLPQTNLRARIALRVGLLMDHVMSTEMLRRLKLLIETYNERILSGETNRSSAPHQKSLCRLVSEVQAQNGSS